MVIDKELWSTCKICQQNIKNLAKKYGGNGIYYSQVFSKHLEVDHKITPYDYFNEIMEIPICGCGICNKKMSIRIKPSSNFFLRNPCGRHKGTDEFAKRMKISRLGSGNPMYGKTPWNKDLSKDKHESIARVSRLLSGRKIPEESKKRMSESAKRRTVHGHTGHKHTEENKEKCRQRTLKMIHDGKFKQTRTKPHILMSNILDELQIEYIEEKSLDVWSFDFYLPLGDIYIEVDGDYFHTNPKIFPDGPKTNTQKINHYRDSKKNKFCADNSIRLLRFWESDILNNKEFIKCTVKESLE